MRYEEAPGLHDILYMFGVRSSTACIILHLRARYCKGPLEATMQRELGGEWHASKLHWTLSSRLGGQSIILGYIVMPFLTVRRRQSLHSELGHLIGTSHQLWQGVREPNMISNNLCILEADLVKGLPLFN